jgi:hypothetical protein
MVLSAERHHMKCPVFSACVGFAGAAIDIGPEGSCSPYVVMGAPQTSLGTRCPPGVVVVVAEGAAGVVDGEACGILREDEPDEFLDGAVEGVELPVTFDCVCDIPSVLRQDLF